MTIERIIEMLQAHLGNLQAEYSLAMARIDVPAALNAETQIILTRHTLALVETLKGQ
jgi:hypothetical protein